MLELDIIQQDAERRAEEAGYDIRWEKGCVRTRFPKANGKIGVLTLPLEDGASLEWIDQKLLGLDYFTKRGMEIFGRESNDVLQ